MGRQISPEMVAAIKALRAKGHSITEICQMTGVSRCGVHGHAKDVRLPNGPLKSGPRRKIPVLAVYRFQDLGLGYRDIAARLGCGVGSVHRILKTRKLAA